METKHTPGPWSWIKMHGQHIVECRKETVAHIDTLNESDADLIAAAPELLAEVEISLEREYNGFEPDNQNFDQRVGLDVARTITQCSRERRSHGND